MHISRLTIPGTHGTWPKRIDRTWEGWGRWYIVITRPTQQISIFGGRRKK